jgi:thioredoxin reductase
LLVCRQRCSSLALAGACLSSTLPARAIALPSHHGFLGQDGKTPRAIIDEGKRQIALYPTVELIQAEATVARRSEGKFAVTLADRREVFGSRLILAASRMSCHQ